MTDISEFKRMNYFKGFFTTADDWKAEQRYHKEKLKLHNRGVHTPGIMGGVATGLQVKAHGGMDIEVQPGAAIDGYGNEIFLGESRTLTIDTTELTLPKLVYICLRYEEEETDEVVNVELEAFSGNTRVTEGAHLTIATSLPDNLSALELARIDLQKDVKAVSDPADPANPKGNEIDRRYVVWAGSVGIAEPSLPTDTLEGIITGMQDGRRDFAALSSRYPVPSAHDARHAALTVEILARMKVLHPEQVPDVLAAIAAIEQDAGQEIGAAYPAVAVTSEFQAYQEAVNALLSSLQAGEGLDILLTRQAAVSEAARELSEVVIQPPIADAGEDQSVTVSGDEATVELDASKSQVFGGRTIVKYRWTHTEG